MACVGKFCLDGAALLLRDLSQWAVADERVAVLNLFDNHLRKRPPAGHVAQVLGNLLDGLRGAVREQQNGLFSHWISPGGSL